MLTPEIVMLEFPVFFSVIGSVVLSPTVSFPKLSCDAEDTRLVVELEVLPLRPTVASCVPLTFLMLNEPLNVPDVVGLNPTAKYVVAPGASEKGTVKELMLNIELLITALVTVTVELPEFLIVNVCVTLFPTGTVPNDTDEGVDVSNDDGLGFDDCVEVLPLSGTVTSVVPLIFLIVNVPLNVPDDVGLNPTAKNVVPPGASTKGRASELMLNAGLLIVAVVTVKLDVPTFLIARVCVSLFPIDTAPYDTDEGVEVSEEACASLGVSPTVRMAAHTAATAAISRRKETPGRMLFKKACWKTLENRFWQTKNRVL